MMKHSKRFLCLLLTLILAASLCVFPAAAADQTCPSSQDDPVVFVHGLMGWGQRAGINAVIPYWGMTTGSLTSYLNSLGYETYSATVGPISSAWDRACELYAQLTGTTVDSVRRTLRRTTTRATASPMISRSSPAGARSAPSTSSATASAARPRASSSS